jgi:hypothetical protein
MVPGLTHQGMAVADGTAAGLAYGRLTGGSLPAAERASLGERVSGIFSHRFSPRSLRLCASAPL